MFVVEPQGDFQSRGDFCFFSRMAGRTGATSDYFIFSRTLEKLGRTYDQIVHTLEPWTSIIQCFVNKCNNSNSCKLFYLDYKSMQIHKWPQTPYRALPLDWQVWAQENTVYSAYLFGDERGTLLGNQILRRWSGIISIHVTPPRLYECLRVHVIADAWLVRCVLVRISPNRPNTNETAVNRC